MLKYVALLRGITPSNPNMRNERLCALFEGLGLSHVQTVISSGNVLFESQSRNVKELEATIEKFLPKKLGFTSAVIIRSQEQLQQLVARNPFKGMKETAKSRFNVTFLKNEPKTDLKFPYHRESYKILGIYERAICSVLDLSGTKTPDLMLWLEKQFGKEITTRTWKTVMRILKKFDTAKLKQAYPGK